MATYGHLFLKGEEPTLLVNYENEYSLFKHSNKAFSSLPSFLSGFEELTKLDLDLSHAYYDNPINVNLPNLRELHIRTKNHPKLVASLINACSTSLKSLKYEYGPIAMKTIENVKSLECLEFSHECSLHSLDKDEICSHQNLKIIRGIKEFSGKEFVKLFDSCGSSLIELSISDAMK